MKFALISGSTRENSQSLKVAQWLENSLKNKKYETDLIDLYAEPLPIWNDTVWKADSDLSKQAKPYQDRLSSADALVIVTPEWHGMVPGGLKNFLLYLSAKQVGHKPCLLVGVSASRGGSYPIAELRMNASKNNRMLFLPEHLIVQDVVNVMNDADPEKGEKADQYIKNRAVYALGVLAKYAETLKPLIASGDLLDKNYPNGM